MNNPAQQSGVDDTPEYPLSAPLDPRDPERRDTEEDRDESQTPEEGVRISERDVDADPEDTNIARDLSDTSG